MRICLITAFPPSHERLNEYGFHLASELQRVPYLSLTILADKLDAPVEELPNFDVIRCWKPDVLSNPIELIRVLRELKPDVVWFNLVFASFGVNPLAAFAGLCTPAMTRILGYSTHVTLHHVMESVNLADAGVKYPRLYRAAGWIATRMLLMANSVTVLLPAYRRTLVKKYRGKNVHLRAHGIFASSPEFPDFSRRGNPHRVLAFGKWGTYKRLELALEAFADVVKRIPDCKLIIAGENHPTTPGYVESVAERVKDRPQVEVHGYVPEQDLAELFRTATVLLMPYTSAGGSSGVAHLACQFGVPIISADIPDFRDMAAEEGIAIDFHRPGDAASLANCVVALLQDAEKQRDMGERNFSAALRFTMPQIIRRYLSSFDWHLRGRTLRPVSALRNLQSYMQWRFGWHRLLQPSSTASLAPVLPMTDVASTQELLRHPPVSRNASQQVRCSIILPVYAETEHMSRTVTSILSNVAKQHLAADVIVVGPDTVTSDTATNLPRSRFLRVLPMPAAATHGGLMRHAIANARGEFLIIADPRTGISGREARKLLRALEEGADVVFASRRSSPRNGRALTSRCERVLSAVAGALLGTRSGRHSGLRASTRTAAEDIFRYRSVNGWSDTEVLFVARKLGFNIIYLPVQGARSERKGESGLTMALSHLINVLQVHWHNLRGGYSTPELPAESLEGTASVSDQAA